MRRPPGFLQLTFLLALFTIDYGFGIGVSGLAYIGLGPGFVLATVVGASVADSIYHKVCLLTTQPTHI